MKRISVVSDCPLMLDVVLVNASQLLYHIVWPSVGTIEDLVEETKRKIGSYGTEAFILFDWYDDVSPKDHEWHTRALKGSTNYQLNRSTPLLRRKEVMNNFIRQTSSSCPVFSALSILETTSHQ